MKTTSFTTLALVAITHAAALPKRGNAVAVTPHDKFSSSIGVLGCKIDTNRVAYWPGTPDCNNICVRVNANGRSVHLLKIDSSGGAHDISYDAWNVLGFGESAAVDPHAGNTIDATYEDVPMSECAHLIKPEANGKLAFSAANSLSFILSCPASSWVAQNHALYNIANSACTLGFDEVCHLDMSVSNQPACPHQLGAQEPLKGDEVWDIIYHSGETAQAL